MIDCSFTQHDLNIHPSGYSAVYLLHGWCHVKLPLSRCPLRVNSTTMHQITVSVCSTTIQPCTSLQYHFAWSHICNLPPALLAEWSGSFTCYCSKRGWNGYRNMSQHRKLTTEKKILPPFLPWLEPGTFRSRVRRSTTGPGCPCYMLIYHADTEFDDDNMQFSDDNMQWLQHSMMTT